MTELQTKPALLAALKKAAARPLTEREARQQRVSFILGMVSDKSNVTREKVEQVLAKQEGKVVRA